MPLDVYLTATETKTIEPKIYVRRDGANIEISRYEWDVLYPGVDPLTTPEYESTEVFYANITNNLTRMADAAGIYHVLWYPEKVGATKAHQLIEPLTEGLARLKADPDEFKKYNPKNGWGNYEGLVDFVERYLAACIENPEADIGISR